MKSKRNKNVNNFEDESSYECGHYFDFQSIRLLSYSEKQTKNLFLSLKSFGTRVSNKIDLNVLKGNKELEKNNHKNEILNSSMNLTKEDLEIESGIILKRYGQVLHVFLPIDANPLISNLNTQDTKFEQRNCLLCQIKLTYFKIPTYHLVINTNLLRKYYPYSIHKSTLRYKKLCKVIFFELNTAIMKAQQKNSIENHSDKSKSNNSQLEDFLKKKFDQLNKTEMYTFRKFWLNLEEIKFDEKKEFLFKFYDKRNYSQLFQNYFRINQFNLIRPKLHVNELSKIQKHKYDSMWRMRQKILKYLVNEKSESFVLGINVSQLMMHQPDKTQIEEQIGNFEGGNFIFMNKIIN